jgi:hypothetical protein
MQYFKYSGHIYICSQSRIQVHITDMETGHQHNPVLTNKNKAFAKLWNNASIHNKDSSLYFTADLFNGGSSFSKVLKNVNFYPEEEFKNNFAEFII